MEGHGLRMPPYGSVAVSDTKGTDEFVRPAPEPPQLGSRFPRVRRLVQNGIIKYEHLIGTDDPRGWVSP